MLSLFAIILFPSLGYSFSPRPREIGVSANCSTGFSPCGGPNPVCCPSQDDCNFRRGIPVCQNPKTPIHGGFTTNSCPDPYLNSCDVTGILGFCCPIGNVCFNDGLDKTVRCVNALGVTAFSYPSATTVILPSATPILASDARILYAPSNAWNKSITDANCTSSNLVYTTDTINATISFNYSGPSVEIGVINDLNGGVFSVIVDGFDTTAIIDTYIGTDADQLPICIPYQFPPFVVTPPDFSSVENHAITLVFIGPSTHAPTNASKSIGKFNTLAIPDLVAFAASSSQGCLTAKRNIEFYLVLAIPWVALHLFY